MVQVLQKRVPRNLAPPAKYQEFRNHAGILKSRLAKNLNMHFGMFRKGLDNDASRVSGKTSQLALDYLGLFVERT